MSSGLRGGSRRPPPDEDRERLFDSLATVEILEEFLQSRYIGMKRFSLDGAAALIPVLEAMLDAAAAAGVKVVLIGMSHRGRLMVITRIVGTALRALIAGFEDVDPRSVFGSGDVKHHMGATGVHVTPDGREISVHLVSNPSHLEAVNPVLMGRARARQERRGAHGRGEVLAINIHGDAAFAGQGIAAESLNMSGLRAYDVGGVIHLIVNNLIGFTAEPEELHSSRFSSDLARRVPLPVLHVNGEEPEAAVHAGRIAIDYRCRFESDILLDLIAYRRYGHSEIDDPTTTQPLLYRKIKTHPRLWESYGEKIGVGEAERAALKKRIVADLSEELERGREIESRPVISVLPSWWDDYRGGHYHRSFETETAVEQSVIDRVTEALTITPGGFTLHPKVKRLIDYRKAMIAGEKKIDWGMAEALALGSLLLEGTPIRFTGQDCERGTFNQRHAVFIDVETGKKHTPLATLGGDETPFHIYNSVLSEAAPVGFEYGYSRDMPDSLVIWEAQFGDFVNGAQVIIDQFITAGEDKWNLLSGLVMLLPHGYEGQGPEHSSARFERFLQLAGEDNIQVSLPSTAAQYFHLLRRQARRMWRKPLVAITPKSMLRAEPACCTVGDLTAGRFYPVLGDTEKIDATRILACSGKIAHELSAERRKRSNRDTAVITLEQFTPFPREELREMLQRYPRATELVWVQEEPANMGALAYVRPLLERSARRLRIRSVKRTESASPATGSARAHGLEQKTLVRLAFERIGESL